MISSRPAKSSTVGGAWAVQLKSRNGHRLEPAKLRLCRGSIQSWAANPILARGIDFDRSARQPRETAIETGIDSDRTASKDDLAIMVDDRRAQTAILKRGIDIGGRCRSRMQEVESN